MEDFQLKRFESDDRTAFGFPHIFAKKHPPLLFCRQNNVETLFREYCITTNKGWDDDETSFLESLKGIPASFRLYVERSCSCKDLEDLFPRASFRQDDFHFCLLR